MASQSQNATNVSSAVSPANGSIIDDHLGMYNEDAVARLHTTLAALSTTTFIPIVVTVAVAVTDAAATATATTSADSTATQQCRGS